MLEMKPELLLTDGTNDWQLNAISAFLVSTHRNSYRQ